jgi:hypothetical protein
LIVTANSHFLPDERMINAGRNNMLRQFDLKGRKQFAFSLFETIGFADGRYIATLKSSNPFHQKQ